MAVTIFSGKFLGTEFLPTLNEGSLWVTAELPMSTSLKESMKKTNELKKVIASFPEVTGVLFKQGEAMMVQILMVLVLYSLPLHYSPVKIGNVKLPTMSLSMK